MLDIMYEIPKDDNIGEVTITSDYIEHKGGPMITMRGIPALELPYKYKRAEKPDFFRNYARKLTENTQDGMLSTRLW